MDFVPVFKEEPLLCFVLTHVEFLPGMGFAQKRAFPRVESVLSQSRSSLLLPLQSPPLCLSSSLHFADRLPSSFWACLPRGSLVCVFGWFQNNNSVFFISLLGHSERSAPLSCLLCGISTQPPPRGCAQVGKNFSVEIARRLYRMFFLAPFSDDALRSISVSLTGVSPLSQRRR